MTLSIQQKRPQLLSVQALRGLAFLGIFFEHTYLLKTGAWGVSVFFLLSGFLMTYTYYDRPLETNIKFSLQFTYKKIVKLYPLHILTMIAAIPFSFGIITNEQFFKNIFANIFLLQSWSINSGIYFSLNAVSWYLSTCVLLYFCFPFIHKIIGKYTTKKTACLCIVLTFILQVILAYATANPTVSASFIDNFSKWFTYVFPIFRLGDFFIGCNLGYLFLFSDKTPPKTSASLYELLLFFMTAFSLYLYNKEIGLGGMEWYRYTLLYIPTSLFLVYLFAKNQGYLTQFLANKVFIFLGNISSYGFLIHSIIIRYIDKFFYITKGYELAPLKLTIAAIIPTLLISILFSQLEKKLKTFKA